MALSVRGVPSEPGGRLRRIFDGDQIRGLVAEAFAVEEHGFDLWSGIAGAVATAGPVAVAGVAWAQHRGVAKVEARVDVLGSTFQAVLNLFRRPIMQELELGLACEHGVDGA